MKKNIFILILALTIISCEKKYNYKYVETIEEKGISGNIIIKEEEGKIIIAKDDSTAYLEAYEKFCISMKVKKELEKSIGESFSTPISFKLFNEKGVDITKKIFFTTKEKQEKEILEDILSMHNSIKDGKNDDGLNNHSKIDSTRIKELDKFFTKRKDEFSNDGKIWYKPKSAPRYTNSNGLYCYFQTEKGVPSNLRFRLQYYADDWLFFSKVLFSIDGTAYEYIPIDTETDCGDGGMIWEWFDESISTSDMELINSLANAKNAKMKLIGRQYHDIKTISKEQILGIKRTLELYKAMGGK